MFRHSRDCPLLSYMLSCSYMKALALIPLLVIPALNAQTASETMTLAERQASVVQLKQNIEAREERLQEVVSDIKTLDDRTEKRIDKVIETLKNLQDSESSKTRITRLKGEAIGGLKKSIDSYNTERRKIFERIRTDKSSTADALSIYIDKLDERIQKRADQIMELAKSMPPSEDVEKYEKDTETYYNGWYHETTRISDEWKQNRRQGIATEKELREITQALEDAIKDLEARRDTITAKIANGNLTPAKIKLAEQELERTKAILSNRKSELVELSYSAEGPTRKAQGEEADKNTADHLTDLFNNARGDIAEDHWTVLKKYSEAVTERETIIKMKANLAAREKWLSENPE
jgi:septal ring factor EnvC (AmiA/AmiB activator)